MEGVGTPRDYVSRADGQDANPTDGTQLGISGCSGGFIVIPSLVIIITCHVVSNNRMFGTTGDLANEDEQQPETQSSMTGYLVLLAQSQNS